MGHSQTRAVHGVPFRDETVHGVSLRDETVHGMVMGSLFVGVS